jgi:hypothetical protein
MENKPLGIGRPRFLPGDQVTVLNYRKRPAKWQAGEVNSAETHWHADGTLWIQYRVHIKDDEGNHLYFIYVGEKGIS